MPSEPGQRASVYEGMRVLLAVAAAAVVALAWPQREARHVCRSPTARALSARPERQALPDEAVTAANLGGKTPAVERGGCALRIRLLDEVTGKPFSSDVELWRLDLPEDEDWTAGDHLQATKNVGPDGGTFTDLPTGRYRIVVRGQSRSLDMTLELDVEETRRTRAGGAAFGGAGTEFVQMRARYHVVGRIGSRDVDFRAPGSAETFRGRAGIP